MRSHSALFRIFAVLTLLVWTGAYQHDIWLGWIGIDHHHAHHASVEGHGHHHHEHSHHDHSHSESSEHDRDDSVPLPDTHDEAMSLGASKVILDGPKPSATASPHLLPVFPILLPDSIALECEHPPPLGESDRNPPVLRHLAHSVSANAPPVFI
ncbi:MAG: hypothetical protein AAGF67_11240 [Verrucomicrobiota bacterium]